MCPGASATYTLAAGSVSRKATVRVVGAASSLTAPFGSFDTPTAGSTGLVGNVAVTGWALDDIGVTRVSVYRDPLAGETASANGKVYLGDASFVPGARSDVGSSHANFPYADRAGWGYMLLTNFLPGAGNGMFTLYAYAYDADNQATVLGSKAIACANAAATKPFGTIDTPGQGQAVSGSLTNFGWALTPQPASIALDGSTISVYVDGAAVGHPTYNQYR